MLIVVFAFAMMRAAHNDRYATSIIHLDWYLVGPVTCMAVAVSPKPTGFCAEYLHSTHMLML